MSKRVPVPTRGSAPLSKRLDVALGLGKSEQYGMMFKMACVSDDRKKLLESLEGKLSADKSQQLVQVWLQSSSSTTKLLRVRQVAVVPTKTSNHPLQVLLGAADEGIWGPPRRGSLAGE